MDGPGGYYANLSEPVRGQTPHDLTYMCNLVNKINKHTKLKQTHRYRKQIDSCQSGGFGGLSEKCEVMKHKERTQNFIDTDSNMNSIVITRGKEQWGKVEDDKRGEMVI